MPDADGDARAAIMAATDRALREHGYADLSISRIADESGTSKSALYYHYEDKDELLVAFLDHTIERFSADVEIESWDDPEAGLRSLLDRLLPTDLDADGRAFQAALFELRAQAPHEAVYRERFTRTDRLLREAIAAHLEAGIERGRFRPVDPEATAQLFLSVIYGGMLERVTTADDDPVADLRRALDAYLAFLAAEGDG